MPLASSPARQLASSAHGKVPTSPQQRGGGGHVPQDGVPVVRRHRRRAGQEGGGGGQHRRRHRPRAQAEGESRFQPGLWLVACGSASTAQLGAAWGWPARSPARCRLPPGVHATHAVSCFSPLCAMVPHSECAVSPCPARDAVWAPAQRASERAVAQLEPWHLGLALATPAVKQRPFWHRDTLCPLPGAPPGPSKGCGHARHCNR